jgi:uncharacterized protein YgiM (DUF1202 family)
MNLFNMTFKSSSRSILTILLILGFYLSSIGQVPVKGYTRKDGTYVAPHTRSSPNHTKTDNYSYPGNSAPASTPAKGNEIAPSSSDVWVDGYYRQDGTYVNSHYRTAPNNTKTDNFSYPGNMNPYTGKTASGTGKGYVTAKVLNVRSGPSTNNGVTNTLPYGEEINILEINEDWAKIEYLKFENSNWVTKIGFVSKSLIKNSDTNQIKLQTNTQYNISVTAAVIRIEPSNESAMIRYLNYGDGVTLLEIVNSEWVKVSAKYLDTSSSTIKEITGYILRSSL